MSKEELLSQIKKQPGVTAESLAVGGVSHVVVLNTLREMVKDGKLREIDGRFYLTQK